MAPRSFDAAGLPLALPSAQKHLTDAEFEFCLGAAARTQQQLVDLSADAGKAHWTNRPDYARHLLAGSRRHMDFLRFCPAFTGWSLFHNAPGAGAVLPESIPEDVDDILRQAFARADGWVERYHSIRADYPETPVIAPPRRFGEVGCEIDGAIVNHDASVYLERLALLSAANVLDDMKHRPECTIVEIGSGFGGLAYRLLQALPRARYVCVDLPKSLLFATIYLSATLPGRQIEFLPAHEARDALRGRAADLVVNTLSFAEMTECQVADYAETISALIGKTGVLFEQNQNNEHVGMIDCKPVLARALRERRDLPELKRIGNTQGQATLWAGFRF